MARKLDGSAAEARGPLSLPYSDDVVSSLVRIISIWTSAGYQRELAHFSGLPRDDNAIPAIYRLAALGPQRTSALAADLHIPAPTASRLLSRLADAGLAQRIADPDDARASIVTLTDAGAELAHTLFGAGDELMGGLLATWTTSDRAALAHLMHRLADAVEDDAAVRGAQTRKQGA